MNELIRRFWAPPTTMVSMVPFDCCQMRRRAALRSVSVSSLLPAPPPGGQAAGAGGEGVGGGAPDDAVHGPAHGRGALLVGRGRRAVDDAVLQVAEEFAEALLLLVLGLVAHAVGPG